MSLHLPTAPTGGLPSLIDRAAAILVQARSSAEVLEARDVARDAYDAAKKAARLSKAKGAHDTLIAAAHRAQADALEIEAQAKRRLADEYDGAQERGEVAGPSDRHSNSRAEANKATATEIGLTHKEIHDARTIRDAEAAEPGIVRRVLDDKLERGEEPTRAAVREAVVDAAMRGLRGARALSRKNPLYVPPSTTGAAWTHVYGTARAFVEWATHANINLAIDGLNERVDRRRTSAPCEIAPTSSARLWSRSMLNNRTANFAELVWSAAAKVGNNAPAITDQIMKRAFPQTCAEARIEGADKMLRVGVIADVKPILKHGSIDETQIDFSELTPEFATIAQKLKSKTYFVESADEYVDVPSLIAEPALLNDARKFMRRKGEECLAEAKILDELYAAVTNEGK